MASFAVNSQPTLGQENEQSRAPMPRPASPEPARATLAAAGADGFEQESHSAVTPTSPPTEQAQAAPEALAPSAPQDAFTAPSIVAGEEAPRDAQSGDAASSLMDALLAREATAASKKSFYVANSLIPATVELARRIREDCLAMTSRSGAGHIASALSAVDILAVLYGSVMNVDPSAPKDPTRDRFVLSKGHAGSAVYAALAELGFFDRDDLLKNYYENGSSYSGHISHDVPGVELTTGSLGQGLGVATGMALAGRLTASSWQVFCLLGDGELDEGNVWESVLMAATQRLDHLVAIVDRNGMQSFGPTDTTALVLGDVAEKFRAFGWKAVDCDGHDHRALLTALTMPHGGQPLCVVAHTTKGKGVSFMEGRTRWHYDAATRQELRRAFSEIAGQSGGFPAGTALYRLEGDVA